MNVMDRLKELRMFSELLPEDRKYCLRRLPRCVLDAMKSEGSKLVLAGGFIRSCLANEHINDVDLFTTSAEEADRIIKIIADKAPIHKSQNAVSCRRNRMQIQIVHRWVFATPQEVVKSFDFTIARAAIYHDANTKTWHSVCDDRYYKDLATKKLVYMKPDRNEDAGGSMLRVLKFYQRGYRIPLDSMGDVIARLMRSVDMDRIRTEEGIAKVVTGLLREVDPNIDPEHDAHLSPINVEDDQPETQEV